MESKNKKASDYTSLLKSVYVGTSHVIPEELNNFINMIQNSNGFVYVTKPPKEIENFFNDEDKRVPVMVFRIK